MHFIDRCKSKLAERFGLGAQQLEAGHLVMNTGGSPLHVEFHPPTETVSVYCRGAGARLEELPLPDHYLVLQRALETGAELYERDLLRLYLDEGCFGVVMDCSPLNCPGADDFMAALQALLHCKELLEQPVA